MASDQQLVDRLSKLLSGHPGVEPKRMFGGVCFMLNGNMCIGVHKTSLIVRIGEEQAEALMRQTHVKPMDLTGKVMKGWATIVPEGVRRDADLARFVDVALAFVATLPAKATKTKKAKIRK